MTADLIARLVIFFIAVGIAGAEVYFFRYAVDVSAKVLEKSRYRSTNKTESFGEIYSYSYRLSVRLDPSDSDGREATVGMSIERGEDIQEGEIITVVALAHKPHWSFWQSMVRPSETARAPVRRALAFGFVTVAAIFLGYLLIV